jgi:AcrR family transcriptional regulator
MPDKTREPTSAPVAVATRERLLDEALRLFGEHGYKGTTMAQIEAAAGLTPGAGGLYHHFASKEALLGAGVSRQLQRLEALRSIRAVLGPVTDLRTELEVIARFILAELDQEAQLLAILASEARNRPELMSKSVQRLIVGTFDNFSAWLRQVSKQPLTQAEAEGLTATALGSLFSSRVLRDTLGIASMIEDDTLVDTWAELMLLRLSASAR